jgi:hypothetical protein
MNSGMGFSVDEVKGGGWEGEDRAGRGEQESAGASYMA